MTNKERILNGEKFRIKIGYNDTPFYLHFNEDGTPASITQDVGSTHANIEKFGKTRMKVYSFWFGKKLSQWIYFDTDIDFPELTENELFFKKDV